MNLIIERAFIMAVLMSISGFVFCAIFLPFERYARKLVSPKYSSAAFFCYTVLFCDFYQRWYGSCFNKW